FTGHILSHDFVEAALLRRGGWAVRMAAHLDGSYEEAPPSVIDMGVRDRRWCQGNLQHLAVIGAGGLHWVSRLHLARGVLSYATSPLWLGFLVLGGLVWSQQRAAGGPTDAGALGLFALTLGLLVAPKLAALLLALAESGARRAFGGSARLMAGALAELVLSSLLAGVMMLMQSRAVCDVLMGRLERAGARWTADLLRRRLAPPSPPHRRRPRLGDPGRVA
ncbi:MAG TPA: hypothetical protein PKB04_10120, partial [Phenylobacterium sp.]|nr:hypothetical protein [Phenylobacterium sp.]